ncbi:MAG: carboxypeptidase regulatory-like domain-containing protein [Candidatus Schekmanbacteria bacterium]|nr:carboxypeptidase regulatory-like domain-containing protein [Candidatus Schekmanbacteria bacterium]
MSRTSFRSRKTVQNRLTTTAARTVRGALAALMLLGMLDPAARALAAPTAGAGAATSWAALLSQGERYPALASPSALGELSARVERDAALARLQTQFAAASMMAITDESVNRRPAAPLATGSIAGTVTDASGSPIAMALVAAYSLPTGQFIPAYTTSGGTYELVLPSATSYVLFAQADNYAREFYPSTYYVQEVQPVAVVSDAQVRIDFALEPGGSISGSIAAGNTGSPIANAEVIILAENYNYVSMTKTDPEGNYNIPNLPLQKFYAGTNLRYNGTEATNYANEWYNDSRGLRFAQLVALTNGTPNVGSINFVLSPGAVISGFVRDEQSAGIPDAEVRVAPLDYYLFWDAKTTHTTAEGAYAIGGLHPGSYVAVALARDRVRKFYPDALSPRYAEPITVNFSEPTKTADFTLEPGRVISGNVRNEDGDPIEGVTVIARSRDLDYELSRKTGPDGRYDLRGLPPTWDYRVAALADNYASEEFPDLIDIRHADAADVNFELGLGRSVAGVISSAATGKGGLAEVPVVAHVPSRHIAKGVQTNGEGRYFIPGLPPAEDAIVCAYSNTYAKQCFNGKFSEATADHIDLRIGSVGGIDMVLQPGARIFGKITNNDGNPVVMADVGAFDPDTESGGHALTDVNGNYVIGGLNPGNYLVVANHRSFVATFYPGVATPEEAQRVSVGQSDTTVGFKMLDGTSISGTILEGTVGIGGVRVFAFSPSLGSGAAAPSQVAGDYEISGLRPAPDYIVGIESPQYGRVFYDGAANAEAATRISTEDEIADDSIDFSVTLGGQIQGLVTDTAGTPIADAHVVVFDAQGGFVELTATAPDGRYVTTALAPATYTVAAGGRGYMVSAVGGVQVAAGTVVMAPVLELSRGGSIAGSVLGGGAPISIGERPIVYAYSMASGQWIQSRGAGAGAADGSYEIRGLAPGEYKVLAQADGYVSEYFDGAGGLEDAQSVFVNADATTPGINFDLAAQPDAGSAGKILVIIMEAFGSTSGHEAGVWSNDDTVSVGWETPEDYFVVGYSLVWDQNPDTTPPTEVNVDRAATSATGGELADGAYYAHISVLVYDGTEPAWSTTTHAGPYYIDTSAPSAPSTFVVTSGTGNAVLNWTNPSTDPGLAGIEEIRVLRKTDGYPISASDGVSVYSAGPPVLGAAVTITDTGLTNGTTYYYGAFAIDYAGNESAATALGTAKPATTAQDTAAPQSVSGLAIEQGNQALSLTWQNPADGDLAGVVIRYRTDTYPSSADDGTLAADLQATPGTWGHFDHSNLQNGKTYFYALFAYDKAENVAAAGAGALASSKPGVIVPALGAMGAALALMLLTAGTLHGGHRGEHPHTSGPRRSPSSRAASR